MIKFYVAICNNKKIKEHILKSNSVPNIKHVYFYQVKLEL